MEIKSNREGEAMYKITVLLGKIICDGEVYEKGKSFTMVLLTEEITKQEKQGLVKVEKIKDEGEIND